MEGAKIHMVILGISCFEGMAGTRRIRNLVDPLLEKGLISAGNLVYQRDIGPMKDASGTIDGIDYREIGYNLRNPFSLIKFIREGKRYLRDARHKELKNVLYNYGGPTIVNISFIRHAKRLGYKVVGDIVEDNRYEQITHFAYRVKIWSSVYLLKRAWRFSHALTGISNHLYERLLCLSGGRIPVHHLPVSVDLSHLTPVAPFRNSLEISLFYGGSMTRRDGLEFLVKAFDQVAGKNPRIRLVLTGAGTELNLEHLRQLISNAGNSDRIEYKGFLDTGDYYALMMDCDILCMTRIDSEYAHAGFPYKLAEYLAAGKCILATKVGDVPRYLTHGVNALLVDPGSVSQMAGAIETIISDPGMAASMGEQARNTARMNFSAESVSRQFYSILTSV